MRRYTVDGSDALEKRIEGDLKGITRAALAVAGEDPIHALILGGGYGRGEGAVARGAAGDETYNDYDLFVIVPPMSRSRIGALHRRLSAVGHELAKDVGIDVDFGRPVPVSKLAQTPYSLMWMELAAGHRVLHGPPDVLEALPAFPSSAPPLEEATRLLLNRGAGLLQARRRCLEEGELTGASLSFVIRNVNKACLAMGDAVLFLRQSYHPSYVERGLRLAAADLSSVPEASDLREAYGQALEFKLRPTMFVPAKSPALWVEETIKRYRRFFLWYEGRRLKQPMLNEGAYAILADRLPVEGLVEGMKNLARNLRCLGPLAFFSPRRSWRHPRDGLLARLPGLLAQETRPGEEAFLRLWDQVN